MLDFLEKDLAQTNPKGKLQEDLDHAASRLDRLRAPFDLALVERLHLGVGGGFAVALALEAVACALAAVDLCVVF